MNEGDNTDKLRQFKYIYLHPHGIGDLILSMPYIRFSMQNREDLALCVRKEVYNSGFFRNFEFKVRVFGACPRIWNSTQTIKNMKRLNNFAENLSKQKKRAFYYLFNKKESRRLQICKFLSGRLNLDIPFDENVNGQVYLNQNDIAKARGITKQDMCFVHARGASALKSVTPQALTKHIRPQPLNFFYPPCTDNINLNFAVQKECGKIAVIDSLYLHSAGALNKDIDILFVSATVKRFFHTLIPRNIKIKKIVYGNLHDSVKALFYYSLSKKTAADQSKLL